MRKSGKLRASSKTNCMPQSLRCVGVGEAGKDDSEVKSANTSGSLNRARRGVGVGDAGKDVLELSDGIGGVLRSRGGNNTGRSCRL